MIRFYPLIIALILGTSVNAERIANHYEIQDLGKGKNLNGKILIEFEVYDDFNEICNKNVSFKHKQDFLHPNCNDSLCTLITDSGNFKCRVFKNNTYPVYISETLKKNHRYRIKVHLQGRKQQVRKPVIYIHTTDTTPLKISLSTPCNEIFSYPVLSNQNEWEVTSYPNNTLSVGKNNFRYLFWDGELVLEAFDGLFTDVSQVEKDSLLPYLHSSLDAFGFSSQEKADFITYWYPVMQQFSGVRMQFLFNEEVHVLSKLINDKELPVYQFYILWTPIESDSYFTNFYSDKPIPQIEANNYILEWGGVQVNQANIIEDENEF